MSKDLIKKLISKNPQDFEPVAVAMIENSDVNLFSELLLQGDFLFDFVKKNVNDRLKRACNKKNYTNLIAFLKYYSPDFEDFIIETLVKFADEDLTDTMLEIFEYGSDEEKTYCARYFAYIKDSLALEFLKENAFSDDECLSANCAVALRSFEDFECYNKALKMLKDEDDFVKFKAVKFLVSFRDDRALPFIIETMKTSFIKENIAGEIPYLKNLMRFDVNEDLLIILNNIIVGLGEVISLSSVFEYDLYDLFEKLQTYNSPNIEMTLLHAQTKINQLTENDEYLFDEDKNTKNEIFEIKKLLNLKSYSLKDFSFTPENSLIFFALELVQELKLEVHLGDILRCDNQTLILKALEVLKMTNQIEEIDRGILDKITDSNIKAVASALFES